MTHDTSTLLAIGTICAFASGLNFGLAIHSINYLTHFIWSVIFFLAMIFFLVPTYAEII
jgi:hypothetical protein